MKNSNRSIACGLLLAMGLIGCSEEGGASVPRGAGADTKENSQPGADKANGADKAKKTSALSSVEG